MDSKRIEAELASLELQQQQGRKMVADGTALVHKTEGAMQALRMVLGGMLRAEGEKKNAEPAPSGE